jgi:osmotically inducible protein OsmC
MPTRTSGAVWRGGLKAGKGTVKVGKAFEGSYSFASRFETGEGTNPEELLAAAHAGCLSMALAAGLERAGTPATEIATQASATLEKVGEAFRVTKMRLEVRGKVPGSAHHPSRKPRKKRRKDARSPTP